MGVKMKCTNTHKQKKPQKALKMKGLQPKKPDFEQKTKCAKITDNYHLITITKAFNYPLICHNYQHNGQKY